MLPLTDSAGRVHATPSGVPAQWNAGLGRAAEGRLCARGAVDAVIEAIYKLKRFK